ncbi:uncharacterized protein N7479_000103 [Penicillium vulpinum]|uniref:Uncharacterized protein n=1 Tax=Penicillium vulpinum TaxID=29845 RepID=A0A1V6RWM8_9EURO|nr:uncharacterized protein N7479_000103 [Penicillium vulpinum]KAJ5970185.1 hypothetical protein N7479_000103 [Penicillium vulpinum]OQE06172.1 hypothetical protein PENVUL_c019G00252 [Penicillium vulpinum]
MKITPQPATVHEVDRYGNPVLHSDVSATRNRVAKRKPTSYSLNKAQRRLRKSQDCIQGECTRRGSLGEMVKAFGQNPTFPMTIFTSSWDTDSEHPKVYVEQQVYQGMYNGIIVHELAFGGKIQVGKEYVFQDCGDEDRILGKLDLRLRVVSLEQESFNNYVQSHTTYYGYDIKDYFYLDGGSISKESPHTTGREMNHAPYKISLNAKDLQILLRAK